ncbi:MAG: long-chain fatty acid--CoA ligase, partial [Proteobacteria bacterium]|nr:long-chain fatty acid--CoA ligase [Pseudomonadota bacterium]
MSNNDQLTEYTIPQLLRWRVGQTPKRPALREKDFGIWNTYSWEDYYDHVRKTALGLKNLGLGKGDTIAVISDNIPELLFTAIGAHSIGAMSAGIYQTSMPAEISQICQYLKVSAVFCDNQEQVDKVLEVREELPLVKKVIFEDPRGMREYMSDDWFIDIADLYKLGQKEDENKPNLFESLLDQ